MISMVLSSVTSQKTRKRDGKQKKADVSQISWDSGSYCTRRMNRNRSADPECVDVVARPIRNTSHVIF